MLVSQSEIYTSRSPKQFVSSSPFFVLAYNYNTKVWAPISAPTTYIGGTYQSGYTYYVGQVIYTNSTIYANSSTGPSVVYTNAFPDEFSSAGLTADDVQAMIDQQFQQTAVGQQANTIITNSTSVYNQYINGSIDAASLQAQITANSQQLEQLSQSSSASLADLMAINNGLTYNQTIMDSANKDQIIDNLQASPSVASTITGKINEANQAFQQYSSGAVNQSTTVTNLNTYITQLTQLITADTPTADINAINAAINTINGIRDSVTGHSDLDQEISNKFQEEENKEIEYLDSLEELRTSTIQDMSAEKQFETQEISSANNILLLIWDNEVIKRLVPICAIFMVVCVVLGIRYRL